MVDNDGNWTLSTMRGGPPPMGVGFPLLRWVSAGGGTCIRIFAHVSHVAAVTFVNLIFRNFGCNDNVKSFFFIVGTSWMGLGRVEWDWHIGMSYLTSLKNIAYVGSLKHFFQPSPSLTAVEGQVSGDGWSCRYDVNIGKYEGQGRGLWWGNCRLRSASWSRRWGAPPSREASQKGEALNGNTGTPLLCCYWHQGGRIKFGRLGWMVTGKHINANITKSVPSPNSSSSVSGGINSRQMAGPSNRHPALLIYLFLTPWSSYRNAYFWAEFSLNLHIS